MILSLNIINFNSLYSNDKISKNKITFYIFMFNGKLTHEHCKILSILY